MSRMGALARMLVVAVAAIGCQSATSPLAGYLK